MNFTPKRRWFQFSLSSLLWLVLVASLVIDRTGAGVTLGESVMRGV